MAKSRYTLTSCRNLRPYRLYELAIQLPDSAWRSEIARALVESRDARCLYCTGLNWPRNRYTPEIARAIVETGEEEWISHARRFWGRKRRADLGLVHRKPVVPVGRRLWRGVGIR